MPKQGRRETFGQILDRLLGDVPLARLARAADVDYAHLHTLKAGVRNGKAVRPSPELIVKLVPALRGLGMSVSADEEAALMDSAVRLPEGFHVAPDADADLTLEREYELPDGDTFKIYGLGDLPPEVVDGITADVDRRMRELQRDERLKRYESQGRDAGAGNGEETRRP